MRSEDDRRLNRTKNPLARTEPYRARGETNLLSLFFSRLFSSSSFVNLFEPFRVVSPSDARSTDSRVYLAFSLKTKIPQNDDGEHVRRGEVARGQSQGVHVPQVHAFNVLRAAFADKELSTETVGFAARGLTAAIKGFSSPHWEVRTSGLFFLFFVTRKTLKSSLPTPANDSRVRFVLQPQHARVAARDVFRNVPAGARASRVSGARENFSRATPRRDSNKRKRFFVSFLVSVTTCTVRTGEPSRRS